MTTHFVTSINVNIICLLKPQNSMWYINTQYNHIGYFTMAFEYELSLISFVILRSALYKIGITYTAVSIISTKHYYNLLV